MTGDCHSLLTVGRQAAFHGKPHDAIAPLRFALAMAEPHQRAEAAEATWVLGVALGAAGSYGAALDVLVPFLDAAESSADNQEGGAAEQRSAAALAAATVASVHRQLGSHAVAAGFDRRGMALTTGTGAAAFDCRLGLAADAVGCADSPAAATELDLAAALIPAGGGWWRQRVRLEWVRAEVALLTNRPADAVTAAAAAVDRADQASAPRHLAKSLLFLGVAQRQVGNPTAVAMLTAAAELATQLGTWPLVWPARAVCAAEVAGSDPTRGRQHRAAARAVVARIAADLPTPLRAQWSASPDIAALLRD